MKKLVFSSLLTLMASSSLFALSPLDRSAMEIRDITSSRELRRLLPPADPIVDIRRVERGYLISTRRLQLYVEVVYGPYGAAAEEGGGSSNLQFGEPKEIK